MGTQCYFTSWTVFLLLLYLKKKKWAATSIEGLENMTSAIKNFHFTTPSCFSRSSNKHSATTDANG